MSVADLGLVRAIRGKLKYHEARQRVLSENVANASTPGFRGLDLAPPDFFRMAADTQARTGVAAAVTNPRHIAGTPIANRFGAQRQDGYEVTPDGNAVVLEEQMMKVAENQMEYQVAASLYQRSLGLLRSAVRKG